MVDDKQSHLESLSRQDETNKKSPMRQMPGGFVPTSTRVILENAEYSRAQAKWLVVMFLVALACLTATSFALTYSLTRPPTILSFATDTEGRLYPLAPLDDPNLTDQEVEQWAADKIIALNRLTPFDYLDHLNSFRSDFVEGAYRDYERAILASKKLTKIRDGNLVTHAEPTAAPRILQQGLVRGRHAWKVEMPFRLNYSGGATMSVGVDLVAEVLVVRAGQSANISGVQIAQYRERAK